MKKRPENERDLETGQFLLGHTGLGGRPKGARNKLTEDFLRDLAADFEAHGAGAIETMRVERPAEYIKVIASLCPKELQVTVDEYAELSDDELDQVIRGLATALSLEINPIKGVEIEGKTKALQ